MSLDMTELMRRVRAEVDPASVLEPTGRHLRDVDPGLAQLSDAEYWRSQEMMMEVFSAQGMLPPAYYRTDDRRLFVEIFERLLPPTGVLLDIMSGEESNCLRLDGRSVIGIGVGAESMTKNPVLDGFIVHDLNADPRLPIQTPAHAAMLSAGIMYLTSPVEVLASTLEALRPGAPLLISWSELNHDSRWSTNLWNNPGAWNFRDRAHLVESYLRDAGWRDPIEVIEEKEKELVVVAGVRP